MIYAIDPGTNESGWVRFDNGRSLFPKGEEDIDTGVLTVATGARVPADGDGLDLLDDAALRARPFVAGQNSTHDIIEIGKPASSLRYRWLVAGDLKLIVSSGINDATEPPRLFDLKADPAERHDLAGARPADVKRLTAQLDGWWTGR
jgi:uncharacterized sulfatase